MDITSADGGVYPDDIEIAKLSGYTRAASEFQGFQGPTGRIGWPEWNWC
jgi:hypothetical protein